MCISMETQRTRVSHKINNLASNFCLTVAGTCPVTFALNYLAKCSRTEPFTFTAGQTGRSLEQHLREHHRALRKGDVLALAVAEHVFGSGHQMDLSKATVMDSHPHTQTQCLLESWYIQHGKPLSTERRA